MIANIPIELDRCLSPEDLKELLQAAEREDKSLDTFILESAKEKVAKIRQERAARVLAATTP